MAGIGHCDRLDTGWADRAAENLNQFSLVFGERIETEFGSQRMIPCQHRWRCHGTGLDRRVKFFG
jgi:hypothetical protein